MSIVNGGTGPADPTWKTYGGTYGGGETAGRTIPGPGLVADIIVKFNKEDILIGDAYGC